MFLGQGTSGKVNNNSENNLRVFINGHFATNSMFSVVAGLKVTVVLQRFFFFLLRGRELESCFYNVVSIQMTKLQEV